MTSAGAGATIMAKKLAFLFTALALVGLVAGNRRAALDFTQRPLISTKPVRNVCLVFYQGIVHCDADKDPSTYSGYEVELFRKSSAYLYSKGREEWAPENYTFTCMGWDGLMEDLLLEPASRTCDVGVAGISATSERIAAGYHFTYPTYNSGRRIMIAMSATVDMFLFLKPFDQSVWLLLFTTSVVVCISVLLAEVPIRRIFRRPAPALEKYCNLQWAATGMLLQATQQFTAKSTGARLMILGYAFLVLIVINMYIATLASQLTVTTINLKVNGLSDVINKPVGIFEADVDNFKRFNLDFAVPLPWNDAQDEVNMIAQLRSGIVQALILDAPFVEYHAAESCDLYAVGEMLLPVNLAYAFPSDVPLDYIELFNQALTIMEEQGTMGDLQQQFITPPGGCPSKKSNVASSTISLQQVAGLWVFLGAAVVAGLSWNCCSWFLRHRLARGAGLKVSHSLNSTNSVLPSADSVAGSVRNRSLINANPELSWLSVAEATTQEEAMEMMEGHVKVVDQRVKQLSEAIEHRFASLNEQLFGLAPEPVYQVAFTRKKSFSEKATDALATVFGSKTAQGSAQRLPSFGGNGDDAPEAVAVISLPSMPVKQQPSGSLTTTPSGLRPARKPSTRARSLGGSVAFADAVTVSCDRGPSLTTPKSSSYNTPAGAAADAGQTAPGPGAGNADEQEADKTGDGDMVHDFKAV